MKKRGQKKGNLQNGFIIALLCSVALAFRFPGPGAKGGWMRPDLLNNAGIALILFLQGLAMAVERMKSGAGNWRLHLIIQSFTFLLFPVVGLVFHEITRIIWPSEPSALRDGFLYLWLPTLRDWKETTSSPPCFVRSRKRSRWVFRSRNSFSGPKGTWD